MFKCRGCCLDLKLRLVYKTKGGFDSLILRKSPSLFFFNHGIPNELYQVAIMFHGKLHDVLRYQNRFGADEDGDEGEHQNER